MFSNLKFRRPISNNKIQNANKSQITKCKSQTNSKYQSLKNKTTFKHQLVNYNNYQFFGAVLNFGKLKIEIYLIFAVFLLVLHQ
jgi:hypothetical protein